jgi:prevent-host-death family protein
LVKKLSATEAARRFSDVLDEVESRQETFVIVRNGKLVAQIGPTAACTGRTIKEVLRDHRPDRKWAEELFALRSGLPVEDRPWPG